MRHRIVGLVCVLAALGCAGPATAQDKPAGWASFSLADWRRIPDAQQGGAVLGAMNAAAWAGWRCPRPISATMVRSVLTSTGVEGVAPDDHFFQSVLMVMDVYFGCGSKKPEPTF